MAAAATGDLEGLLSLLAPDITWVADGDGRTAAARRPVVGAEKVAAILQGIFRTGRLADLRIKRVTCNSAPAMVVHSGDRPEGVFLVEIIEGRITGIYAVRKPDKLVAVAIERRTSR
ncbi:hypothetical protein [Streptomyces sp. NPDC048442]|uniref:hypothetical protein n=1 Tax=Streptomyces sp. NPDC048442 TaxID=3154823 RepID=UPI00343070D7